MNAASKVSPVDQAREDVLRCRLLGPGRRRVVALEHDAVIGEGLLQAEAADEHVALGETEVGQQVIDDELGVLDAPVGMSGSTENTVAP